MSQHVGIAKGLAGTPAAGHWPEIYAECSELGDDAGMTLVPAGFRSNGSGEDGWNGSGASDAVKSIRWLWLRRLTDWS